MNLKKDQRTTVSLSDSFIVQFQLKSYDGCSENAAFRYFVHTEHAHGNVERYVLKLKRKFLIRINSFSFISLHRRLSDRTLQIWLIIICVE